MARREDGNWNDEGPAQPPAWVRRVLSLLNWSFPIGVYLNIRIRVHVTFPLVVIVYMLSEDDPVWTGRWLALLFVSVLLHEFGHCLSCRRMGGQADDILIWPLGGLAMCRPPRHPIAEGWTVAWGPLVNAILALGCFLALWAHMGRMDVVGLNPLRPWGEATGSMTWVAALLRDFYAVNYMLLWLNLALIFPPFDGGGLLQAFIWAKWDRPTSLKWGARLGMGGAVVVGLFALAVGKSLLLLLAMFGFFHAYQMGVMARLGLDEQGTSEPEREWWQGGGADESDEPKPGWLARRRAVRAERRAVAEAEARHALERELDRILAKVKAQGMSSLTAGEKRALKAATEFRRNERR